ERSPVRIFEIDLRAVRRAPNADALVAGRTGSEAHRLADRRGRKVGLGIQEAAGAGVDVLDHRDRAEIVAPSFAAIEQAAEHEREGPDERPPVPVVEQNARADSERQEGELEIVMIAP